ncbi:phosphoribosylanthranilate isomerase [Candidatus Caldarchaeum subterraneum]|uniref:N-(5'-phosphoribosyl)anthranilate isomerase n=1 Tax=Caldiarchaeum subterraneum TaxID=311458 RepID=E6N6L7_CALS0|nr:phosphoribosylanthranilate isomerase [Candidatus Caldarchaeum subterraneum]BAJ50782.1 phosphoribosylanthranilate isomerase [Candidatus Caldarchaeum subterraneum]
MLVKVCCNTDVEEIKASQIADLIGVVTMSSHKKAVSLKRVRELMKHSEKPVVLVSDSMKLQDWIEIILLEPPAIQIHGDIPLPDFKKIQSIYGGLVIKSITVPTISSDPLRDAEKILHKIKLYEADYYLLDSGKASGKLHDIRISRIVASRHPVMLAGGLTPENVVEVIRFVRPIGVDASSGLEINGRKSQEKIKRFVEAVKSSSSY